MSSIKHERKISLVEYLGQRFDETAAETIEYIWLRMSEIQRGHQAWYVYGCHPYNNPPEKATPVIVVYEEEKK